MKRKIGTLLIVSLLLLSNMSMLLASNIAEDKEKEVLNQESDIVESIDGEETILLEEESKESFNDEVLNKTELKTFSETITPAGVGDTIAQTFPDPNFAKAVADRVASGDVNKILTPLMVSNCTLIDARGKGIQNITGVEVLSKLFFLELSDNQIEILPDTIGTVTSLKTLYLSDNKLTSLPESIGSLNLLENLNLNNNQLASLPTSFTNLTNMKQLQLGNNKLSSLPESIGNLNKLNLLYLHKNQLTSLPESFVNLNLVTSLLLYNNLLTGLPEDFGNLNALKSFQIQNNQLKSLPESLGSLSVLETLHIYKNQLTSLPESIGNLRSLKYLHMDNNQLESLPESFGNLNKLEILGAFANKLKSLPDSFGNLSSLEDLTIYTNELTSLPANFGNLSNLNYLDAYDNKLTNLPDSFGNLSGLIELRIYTNELTGLPANFGNLSDLNYLDAYNNKLTSLPDNFGNLSSAQYIYLNSNQLASLPESIGNLSGLKILYLHNNKLTSIPESIGGLSSIDKLSLGGNQLATLPQSMGGLSTLTNLWLFNNLLPTNYPSTLNTLGFGFTVNYEVQDQLELKEDAERVYTIKTEDDFTGIDLASLLDVDRAGTTIDLLPSHTLILGNYMDEEETPVSLETYLKDGKVQKEGTVYAQLRTKCAGLFPNTSDHAVTTEYIQLNFAFTYYDLSFDLNGATGTAPATQNLPEGTTGEAVTDPMREGYSFLGWNTAKDGSETSWKCGTTLMLGEDVLLYAQWKENEKPSNKNIVKINKDLLPKTGGYSGILISMVALGTGLLVSFKRLKKK